jgi:hypothetical protein
VTDSWLGAIVVVGTLTLIARVWWVVDWAVGALFLLVHLGLWSVMWAIKRAPDRERLASVATWVKLGKALRETRDEQVH